MLRYVYAIQFDRRSAKNVSLETDVWSNHHVTSFLKTDHYICLSISLSLSLFFTANVPETLIRGSHRVTQSRLGTMAKQPLANSIHPPSPLPPFPYIASLRRIDYVEVPDVFLLESAVITGIFYRQEEDIYTADVLDDRGGSLAPFLPPENDATFSLSTGGEMIHGRSSQITTLTR